MKRNLKDNMTQHDNKLGTVWGILKRVPFMCMVRIDSPSQRVKVPAPAWRGPVPFWSGCQAMIGRDAEEGLCADMPGERRNTG